MVGASWHDFSGDGPLAKAAGGERMVGGFDARGDNHTMLVMSCVRACECVRVRVRVRMRVRVCLCLSVSCVCGEVTYSRVSQEG